MANCTLDGIVREIADNYSAEEIFFTDPSHHFPKRSEIIEIVTELRRLMFPRYFGDETACTDPEYFIGETIIRIRETLKRQLREAFLFRCEKRKMGVCDEMHDCSGVDEFVEKVSDRFICRLPEIQRTLLKDVQAAFDGDPAAQSKEEIIFSYPGFFAIFVYRIAHEFYIQDVPLIPRIMTEYAHSETGVDINAGAEIGGYFFIDHATGVVIGETTKIGEHVKVYQGVTLGALSTRGGQDLSGKKRHPTIEDNVTIYSNASILGGETVVGEGSIIGGSAFITSSVPPNARVSVNTRDLSTVREAKPNNWFTE